MLKETFVNLATGYSDDLEQIDRLWEELECFYLNENRYYHSLSHLENVLLRLKEIRELISDWDTILFYAFDLCDRLNPKSKTFEYCVSWITSTFGKSKIMGMDKVYIMMADRYYCSKNTEGKSPAFWMTEPKLKDLCEK